MKVGHGHLEHVTRSIHRQLTIVQGGAEADNELAEFVCVMINNQKTLGDIEDQIVDLLAFDEEEAKAAAAKFCSWLKDFLVADIKQRQKVVQSSSIKNKRGRDDNNNLDLSLEQMVAVNKRQKRESLKKYEPPKGKKQPVARKSTKVLKI